MLQQVETISVIAPVYCSKMTLEEPAPRLLQVLTRFGFSAVMAQSGALILRSYTIVALVLGACHFACWRFIAARKAAAVGRDSEEHTRTGA